MTYHVSSQSPEASSGLQGCRIGQPGLGAHRPCPAGGALCTELSCWLARPLPTGWWVRLEPPGPLTGAAGSLPETLAVLVGRRACWAPETLCSNFLPLVFQIQHVQQKPSPTQLKL